jgi:alkaline phosphatase D
VAHIVQLSDSHLSHRRAHSLPNVDAVIAWINDVRPDLVVHTGDIAADDPDDAEERAFAFRHLSTSLDVPLVAIPGNHDVGGFSGDLFSHARLDAFRSTWHTDTFLRDVGAWRLVGANVYRLGEHDHDEWLRAAVATTRPIALFLHQPYYLVAPEVPDDGDWSVPVKLRRRLAGLIETSDVRLVASGHLHSTRHVEVAPGAPELVLCPSAAFTGEQDDPSFDYPVGAMEMWLDDDGRHRVQLVEPPGTTRLAFAEFAGPDAVSMRDAPLLPYRPVA